MGKARTCGECRKFFACYDESTKILDAVPNDKDLVITRDAPACCIFEGTDVKTVDIVGKVRALCHEATQVGEASALIVAALELAEEYEKLDRLAEACGKAIDDVRAMIEVVR